MIELGKMLSDACPRSADAAVYFDEFYWVSDSVSGTDATLTTRLPPVMILSPLKCVISGSALGTPTRRKIQVEGHC